MAARKPLQDKLIDIEFRISKHQEQITKLKAKRVELMDAERKSKVEKLVEVMESNNISVDELIEKIDRI